MMYHAGSFLKIPHKFWEIQTERWDKWTNYFSLDFTFNRKCDHAGFKFHIEIIGFYFSIDIYDHRHWNYDEDKWESS